MPAGLDTGNRLSAVSVGNALPTLEVPPLRRIQIAYMLVANNDPAEIHVDEPYARAAGFPAPVAQGSFVLGYLGKVLSEWAGLDSVRSLDVEFRGAVFAGDALVVGGEVAAVDAEDGRPRVHVDMWVRKSNGSTVARARAVLGAT